MLKKYIKILLIIVVVGFLLQVAIPTLALEANYPTINFGGTPYNVTYQTTLLQYIQYFFVFIVTTAGIFGVVSIVLNSLRILLAFGSPESISKARTDIFGSVLGIFLLLISVILLTTINRQLVENSFTANGYPAGIYYVGVDNTATPNTWIYEEAKPERNTDSWEYTDWDSGFYDWYLWYNCDPTRTPDKNLLVWLYDRPDYEINRASNGSNNVNTREMFCTFGNIPDLSDSSSTINISQSTGIKSIKWTYNTPGVYFYLKDDCTGISTEAQRINGRIQAFDRTGQTQQALSFQIINGNESTEQYGAVLAKGNDIINGEIGQCTAPTTNTACQKIDYSNPELAIIPITNPVNLARDPAAGVFPAVTAYVFKVARFGITNPSITFQSKYYRNIRSYDSTWQGFSMAFYPTPGYTLISNLNNFIKSGEIFGLNWFTNTSTITNDCNAYNSCLDKISFYKNAYYVVLYSKNYLNQNNAYCYVTTQSMDNIQQHKLLNEGRALYKIYVLPSGDPGGDQQP